MATIAETVVPAVAEALTSTVTAPKPTPKPKAGKPKASAPKPVDATLTAADAQAMTDAEQAKAWAGCIKAIKAGMAMDTRKVKTLEDAKLALLKVRVNIVRDTANAMQYPQSHAKAGKTAGKPSQSVVAEAVGINRLTFAPYWKAANAHVEAFGSVAGEPTEAELELVASFWKAEALRKQAERADAPKAPKSGPVETIADGDTEDGGTDGRPSVTVPEIPTQADVIAAVEALQSVVARFTRDGGFADVVADNLQEVLAEIGTAIDSHRVGGSTK